MNISGLAEGAKTFDELADKFEEASFLVVDGAEDATRDVAMGIRARARDLAPEDDGDLKDSIVIRKAVPEDAAERGSDEATYVVGTSLEYAKFIEFGTRPTTHPERSSSPDPYTIEPDQKDWLKFEVDGNVVYTKEVEHPGIEPQPFLRPALDFASGDLHEELKDQLKSVFRSVGFDG